MSTGSNEVDEIRRQMALIRRELHEDVKEVVATAEAATDWRRYLTAYPWVTLGAAFAVGYWVVPRKHRPAIVVTAVPAPVDLSKVSAVDTTRQTVVDASKAGRKDTGDRKKTLLGAAFGMVAPFAVKAAQGYALKYLEQWILHQQSQQAQHGPPPTHPGADFAPGFNAQGPANTGRPGAPRRGTL